MGKPIEIAKAVAFPLSEDASVTPGAEIVSYGGRMAGLKTRTASDHTRPPCKAQPRKAAARIVSPAPSDRRATYPGHANRTSASCFSANGLEALPGLPRLRRSCCPPESHHVEILLGNTGIRGKQQRAPSASLTISVKSPVYSRGFRTRHAPCDLLIAGPRFEAGV